MKFLSFILVVFLSTSALSQEAYEPDIRDITIDGKEFVAFDTRSALKLLRMKMDYPKLELRINKMDELISLKDQELSLLNKIQDNHKNQIVIFQERNASLQKQIYKNDVWWKSPWLWTAVGIVVGTGITIGVAYSVK